MMTLTPPQAFTALNAIQYNFQQVYKHIIIRPTPLLYIYIRDTDILLISPIHKIPPSIDCISQHLANYKFTLLLRIHRGALVLIDF